MTYNNQHTTIVIPIENHKQLLVQTIILIRSIRQNIPNRRVLIINHNNSNIPEWFIKLLDDEELINISLTNNKWYYKKEAYFLLMPETLKYVNENYNLDAYLFLDPDTIITESLPPASNSVDVFKTPMNEYTDLLLYMFSIEHPVIKKNYTHFDTFCIYSKNKDFINDWYEESVKLSKFKSKINERFQHFCEELAITILMDKYTITSQVSNAFLDTEPIMFKPVYHYDNLKNIYNHLPKKDKILVDVILKGEYMGEDKHYRVINNLDVIKKEIEDFIKYEKSPIYYETIRTLRYKTPYDFID